MGNSTPKPTDTRDPFLRLLLLKDCSQLYDSFNVCVDGIIVGSEEEEKNNQTPMNVHNIKNPVLKQQVVDKCFPLLDPVQKCLRDETNQNDIIQDAWKEIRVPEKSKFYSAQLQARCGEQIKEMKKCVLEGRDKAYRVQEYCAKQMQASTFCAATVMADDEINTPPRFKTSKRQYLF